jgi:hypothetical protein
MLKPISLILVIFFSCSLADAKKKSPPNVPEFPEITARGRMLAEYLAAAAHAKEAIRATGTARGSVTHYIAQKGDSGWVVAFGRYSDSGDRFLILYEATPTPNQENFTLKQQDPPREATGFYFRAAKALDTAFGDFQERTRLHVSAVLPAESSQMYVYFLPAQPSPGVYPLGSDVRYLVSSDGSKILEKRQLHKSIIHFKPEAIPPGSKWAGGYHTHVLSDVPEDTDVAYVLTRRPSGPEFIGAGGKVYEVLEDGTIVRTK